MHWAWSALLSGFLFWAGSLIVALTLYAVFVMQETMDKRGRSDIIMAVETVAFVAYGIYQTIYRGIESDWAMVPHEEYRKFALTITAWGICISIFIESGYCE